jgi:hypothetical protein
MMMMAALYSKRDRNEMLEFYRSTTTSANMKIATVEMGVVGFFALVDGYFQYDGSSTSQSIWSSSMEEPTAPAGAAQSAFIYNNTGLDTR